MRCRPSFEQLEPGISPYTFCNNYIQLINSISGYILRLSFSMHFQYSFIGGQTCQKREQTTNQTVSPVPEVPDK